jgi:electron transfer flavoprotein beta subunit
MKILVAIKRVIDYDVRVRVRGDGSGVVTDGVKFSINPFDEIAIEEALRLREKGVAEEVVVVSIGGPECQQQLRAGMAMGCDRAIQIVSDDVFEPIVVARSLLAIVQKEQPEIVLLGKQATDSEAGQVGQMLAALWNRPQATFASSVEINDGVARVDREVDEGIETLDVDLPAVITTDLRLNEPRYIRLPDILKAKRKPIDEVSLESLGVSVINRIEVVKVSEPPQREPGVMVDSPQALVDLLRQKEAFQ